MLRVGARQQLFPLGFLPPVHGPRARAAFQEQVRFERWARRNRSRAMNADIQSGMIRASKAYNRVIVRSDFVEIQSRGGPRAFPRRWGGPSTSETATATDFLPESLVSFILNGESRGGVAVAACDTLSVTLTPNHFLPKYSETNQRTLVNNTQTVK